MTNKIYPLWAIEEVETLASSIVEISNNACTRLDVIRSFVAGCKKEKRSYYNDSAYGYAISQLPEEEQTQYIPAPKVKPTFAVKSQPSESHKMCTKCGGTGVYAMWIENGIPCSTTGTTCYRCNGKGWIKK